MALNLHDTRNYGNLALLKPQQQYTLLRQLHKAKRAGLHVDFRIGAPQLGLYSWAAPKDLPTQEGQRRLLITQPLHTYAYKDFQGNLFSRYGRGTVKKLQQSPVVILQNTGDKIRFTRAGEKDTAIYTMIRTKNGNWITTVKTPENINKRAAVTRTQLQALAKPYYQPQKWQHIKDVLRIARQIKAKRLSPIQNAAILWHDTAKRDMGAQFHGQNGARIAQRDLKRWYTPQQVAIVAKAIRQHNLDQRIKDQHTLEQSIPHFSSPQAQLLAVADDDRPRQAQKTWEKTLKYHIKGSPQDKSAFQLIKFMKQRLDPHRRMPELKYYKQQFQQRNKPFIKWLQRLSQRDASTRIKRWKQSNGL